MLKSKSYRNRRVRSWYIKMVSFIVDTTEFIKVALWEELIDQVHAGKLYHFKNLPIRIFEDKKFLNSNKNTVIEEIEELAQVNLNNLRTSENFLQGQCIAVQLKSDLSCVICNMSIDTEKAHDGMITCVKCGNSSLLLCVAHITVKMSEQCFNNALFSLVNTAHTP